MKYSLEEELHIEESPQVHNTLRNQLECQSLHLDAPAELRGKNENSNEDKCKPPLSIGVTKSSLLLIDLIGDSSKDIGSELTAIKPPHDESLQSNEQKVLADMKNGICND